MSIEGFLSRKKIGLILRVFATQEGQIPNRIDMVKQMIDRVGSIEIEGHSVITRVDVLVWADPRFGDQVDCGKTAGALREHFPKKKGSLVTVSEVRNGDLFCGILNYGIALQLRGGVDFSMIASSEAYSYMTPETVKAMVEAADKGALAIGVAINELTDSILAGRIANTLAMWHNISLLTVGGFDLRAAKPVNEKEAHFMKSWRLDKGEVFYPVAGVEEVIPLARLADTFGSCIAPILPQGEGAQRYQTPDPAQEPELWERHVSKMGTKFERQSALLAAIGYELSFLEGGVMEEYRS